MTSNMITSQEYEKMIGIDAVWIETCNNKIYFLTFFEDLDEIFQILRKRCKNNLKNIEFDEGIIDRYSRVCYS